MLMLAIMVASVVPAGESPAVRSTGASSSFTASATIVRDVAEAGPGRSRGRGHVRRGELANSAGQPVPAIIVDFE